MGSWQRLLSTTIASCALLAAPALRAQASGDELFPPPPVVTAPVVEPGPATQPAPAVPPSTAPVPVESEGGGFPWGTAIGGGAACTACTLVSGTLSGLGIYFLVESLNRAAQLNDPIGACCLSVIGIVGALLTNAAALAVGGGLGPFAVAAGSLIGALVEGRPPWWALLGAAPGVLLGLSGVGVGIAALTVLEEPLGSLRSAPGSVDLRVVAFGTGVAMALLAPALSLAGAVVATWLASPAAAEADTTPGGSSAPSATGAAIPPSAAPPATSAPAARSPEPVPAPASSPAPEVVDY